MTEVRSGTIVYTERAFEQDADQAMASDIVRALVELITNSDDAYGEGTGEVSIEVVKAPDSPLTVIVRDEAKGLTPDELEKCFGVLGGQTSGFREGKKVRGLLGRGAKDTAAFGRTIFETIRGDTYGRFELARTGTWTLQSHPATTDDRVRLRIGPGKSGLQASIVIERVGVPVPTLPVLGDRLRRHVQLREITTRRVVSLGAVTAGKRGPSTVVRWDEPPADELLAEEISIPGYDATAHLTLRKMSTPSPDRLDAYSTQGIVVRTERTSFANTLFGETSPETAWISGVLDCPFIDTLILEYDQHGGADPKNPSRLLRRDRDGLATGHPFHVALAAAVLDRLAPILEELKPKREALGGGDRLRRDLSQASLAISALLNADLQRLEADDAGGGLRPSPASPIVVIPPRVGMRVGAKRTLTVLVDDSLVEPGDELNAVSRDPSTVSVELVTARVPHATFAGTSVANIRICAKHLGTTTPAASDRCGLKLLTRGIDVGSTPLTEEVEILGWSGREAGHE